VDDGTLFLLLGLATTLGVSVVVFGYMMLLEAFSRTGRIAGVVIMVSGTGLLLIAIVQLIDMLLGAP
jgi:hypothetical protein